MSASLTACRKACHCLRHARQGTAILHFFLHHQCPWHEHANTFEGVSNAV
jgi:hypothetical protein